MPKLLSVQTFPSPRDSDFTRVSGTVEFYNKQQQQTIWFDYPSVYDEFIDHSGNAWLAALLPIAVVEKEDLRIGIPVDPLLLDNVRGIMQLWRSWYNWIVPINVVATESQSTPSEVPAKGTIIFFTGGIDSSFSLLHYRHLRRHTVIPDIYLTTVWGFDVPLDKPDTFSNARAVARSAATRYQAGFIEVVTNLRSFSAFAFGKQLYSEFSYGAALASVGLLFGRSINEVVIGSALDLPHVLPSGAHPLTDPLFSTLATTIRHDGATFNRVEKTRYILTDQGALSNLRVCWSWSTKLNCSVCSKCLRTMVTIDLLGQRALATTFDWSTYSVEKIAGIFIEKQPEVIFYKEIAQLARELGRHDIANAMRKSILKSAMIRTLHLPRILHYFAKYTRIIPVLWRTSSSFDRLRKRIFNNR